MVTLTLHDEDAKVLLNELQMLALPLPRETSYRLVDQLLCALALCDCGRGTDPKATQP